MTGNLDKIRTVSSSKKTLPNRKEIMKFWVTYTSDEPNREERIKENYGLLNSIVDEVKYNAPLDLIVGGEEVSLGYPTMNHFGLIAKVADMAIGEAYLTNVPLSVKDNSNGKRNAVRREKEKLVGEYIYTKYRKPLEDAIMAPIQMAAQMAEQQGQTIPNEQLQQLLQQAQEEIRVKTPEEINDYLEHDYQTQPEGFSQRFINKLSDLCNLPQKKIDALEDVLALAECYFLPSINHNTPEFKVINPKNIQVVYSPDSPFVQDAVAAVVRDVITFQEAFALDGEYLTKADAKKLIDNLVSFAGVDRDKSVYTVADEQVLRAAHYDSKTANALENLDYESYDDQMSMASIYANILGKESTEGIYLERYYVTWRETAYFNRVKRRNTETGEIEYRWEAEHYKLNPNRGDISMKSVEKPQVWHGVMYGSGEDAIVCKVEPVPNQYKSLEDIHKVHLPIFGGKLNTRKGNTYNRAPVDNGKVWNYEFDLLMAEYKLKQTSNLGNVFIMFRELKPQDVTWGEFFSTLRHMKLLLMSNNNEDKSVDPALVQYLKGVDLSTMNEIQGILTMSNFFLRNVYEFMGFSPERVGTISQYMTSSNAQEAINASKVQTLRLYEIFDRQYLEAVNYLFNISKSALKDNKYLRETLLDDIDQAYIMTSWDELDSSQMGVSFSMSPAIVQKIRELKMNSQALIQNSILDLESYINFYMADTTTDLRNLSKTIEVKKQKLQQMAQEGENAKMQQIMQAELQKFQQKFQADQTLQAQKDTAAMDRVMVDSQKFERTVDVNKNQINDNYEGKILDLEFQNRKLEAEISIKNRELDIEEAKLGISTKKVDNDKKYDDEYLKIQKSQSDKNNQKSTK